MSPSTASPEKSSTIERLRRRWRGQSFIEGMVAITIIITAISSSLVLIQSSINATGVGGRQVVAANLAREGLEVARAARDTNWLKSRSFQFAMTDASGRKNARPLLDTDDGSWTISFAVASHTTTNARVYLMGDGVYRQADSAPSGSSVSPYTRLLTLNHICRNDGSGVERIVSDSTTCVAGETMVGLAAVSSVRWRGTTGMFQTLNAEERLYDWR